MEEIEEILERLSPVGAVRARRMFGGFGLYLDELFFALVAGGVLYFKVDESNQGDFEAAGMGPFTYEAPKQGGSRSMAYFELPLHVLESPPLLREWALKARAVAERKQTTRPRPKPRKLTGMRNLGPKSAAWLEAVEESGQQDDDG